MQQYSCILCSVCNRSSQCHVEESGAKCKYDAIHFAMKPQAWHTQASYYISQWDRVTSA